MKINLKKIIEILERSSTKIYLVMANLILVVFAIWFSNVGLLPFKNSGDFGIFLLLSLILALYRPSWTFAFFIGSLVLENVDLAPKNLGVALHPYQLFGFITIFSLLLQLAIKRLKFPLPKFYWLDIMPIIFALSGFIGALSAINKLASFKQAVVSLSFVALYFLGRIYIQSWHDLKRIIPFFLSSSFVVVFYGIWQNVMFLQNRSSFEVMPGRPNGTFTEPDWFGIFLVFLLSAVYAIIYFIFHKYKSLRNLQLIISYLALVPIFLVTILTVSRSAWIGAILLTIGFLKVILVNGTFKPSKWQWRNFLWHGVIVISVFAIAAGFATFLTRFQIFNRAHSTGGLQKITIACEKNHPVLPNQIKNINELEQYNCRHINLEEIAKERNQGNEVLEIQRIDPSVNIRADIYRKSIYQIKTHPVLGIGWGSINQILGADERGAGLNASNIFLEIWLGSGILGVLSFTVILLTVFVCQTFAYMNKKVGDKSVAVFSLLGLTSLIIPNLFNSGIFLGFVWIFLAAVISLNSKKS